MTAQHSDTVAEDWGASRSRVVTWHDPGPSTARGLTMAGLDYLRAMIDGTLPPPPICQLMRFDIVSAESGQVVFTCEPDESAYNGIGVVHGGLVCTLLDSVAALALLSVLPQGRGCTSCGDQGELPHGSSAWQRIAHRDRHSDQGWFPDRLHRRRCIGRLGRRGRYCLQHAGRLRPMTCGSSTRLVPQRTPGSPNISPRPPPGEPSSTRSSPAR
jgi:hypothetical protein